MAAERLPMRKLREIIRLRLQAGQSGRAIARSCVLSPTTASEYLGRIAIAGLTWPLPPELDDDALERLLFPDERHPVSNRPEPDWAWIHIELQRRHGGTSRRDAISGPYRLQPGRRAPRPHSRVQRGTRLTFQMNRHPCIRSVTPPFGITTLRALPFSVLPSEPPCRIRAYMASDTMDVN